MSRPNSAAVPRVLTLTEELERLEQSITLTLQEIDHNFSRAHRIVTSSILPIVEQYTAHSKDVWEGSKFWKQFFESSANVSLSGYEEQTSQYENTDLTATEDSNASTSHTTLETSQSYETPSAQHISTSSIQDLDFSNLTESPSHSTPRPTNRKKSKEPNFADYPSPYEMLKQGMSNATLDATALSQVTAPETPNRLAFDLDDVAEDPQPSPSLPPQPYSAARPSTTRKHTDPLLHRVLDRNYRVQATPLTVTGYASSKVAATTPGTARRLKKLGADPDLSSSPELAPPQLHAEIFSSPQRKPRTPGVSVLTPARNRQQADKAPTRTPGVWDSDEDDLEDDLEFASPPKTMQFHIPQNRLVKTPAKEASKRIVEDILTTAGMGYGGADDDFTDEIQSEFGVDENSPSVVRKAVNVEDDTF